MLKREIQERDDIAADPASRALANKVMDHDVRIRRLETWRGDVEAGRMPLHDRIALYGILVLVVIQLVVR